MTVLTGHRSKSVVLAFFWSFGDPELNIYVHTLVSLKRLKQLTPPAISTATLVESKELLVLQDGPKVTSTKDSPFLILRGHTDAR